MARQKGIVRLKGTIYDLNFYERLGESLVRRSGGGFHSESGNKYPLIRGNMDEMGSTSTTNARFRRAFLPLLTGYKDGTLHYRLQTLFLKIKNLDTDSARGDRRVAKGIATPYGQRLLKDFEFTTKRPVLLNGQLAFDWNTYTLNLTDFDIKDATIPKSADLMGLLLLAVRFDFETLRYVTESSPFLSLGRDFDNDGFSLQTAPLPDGPGLRMVFLRVAYYQEVNGEHYLLPGDDQFGLGILGVG